MVCIMGSSFPHIEFTRLMPLIWFIKNIRVIANHPIFENINDNPPN